MLNFKNSSKILLKFHIKILTFSKIFKFDFLSSFFRLEFFDTPYRSGSLRSWILLYYFHLRYPNLVNPLYSTKSCLLGCVNGIIRLKPGYIAGILLFANFCCAMCVFLKRNVFRGWFQIYFQIMHQLLINYLVLHIIQNQIIYILLVFLLKLRYLVF